MDAESLSPRDRWDARHRESRSPSPPDPVVARWVEELGAGDGRRALDLACGAGRHALLLALRGFQVEAWDVSPVALARVEEEAARQHRDVRVRGCDLEARPLPRVEPFAVVLLVDYLDRELLADLASLVVSGGSLMVATFTRDFPGPRPSPRHRLEPGELRAVPGFATLRTHEEGGRAALLARREGPPPAASSTMRRP